MALRSQLSLFASTPPGSSAYPLILKEYGEVVEGLEFTTVAPGGFGDLACIVKLPEPRLPRPELALFSRVVLRDGLFTCFSGEWSDPTLVLDGHAGDHVLLAALGGGVALREDPDDSAYTTPQTAQAIIGAEFTKRAAFLSLDADLSQVLPTNPATTFSPTYDGFMLEEICHDLAFALGDYMWSVYEHPTHTDAAGYPAWRLEMHPRDVMTTHYLALAEDIEEWRVAPSSQRAYSVVQLAYIDPTNGPAAEAAALGGPRAHERGAGHIHRQRMACGVPERDQQGRVRAARGTRRQRPPYPAPAGALGPQPLRAGACGARPGAFGRAGPRVNQFYLVESDYLESVAGLVRLRLQLDNYADKAGSTLAQLKLAYEAAIRARGGVRSVISPGVPLVGPCGGAVSNQSAGATVKVVVPFGVTLAKTPTSITLANVTSTNASNIQAVSPTQTGFTLQWTAPAAGATSVAATFTTVGN